MKKLLFAVILAISVTYTGCGSNDSNPIATGTDSPGLTNNSGGGPTTDTGWSIPSGEVYDGGPGKDGIPSIDSPVFSAGWPDMSYMTEQDLVVILLDPASAEVRVYPHPILDWHEIVNESPPANGNRSVAYCPLTGSTVIIDRAEIGGSSLGVSGLLYNNNLIMYDRATNSNWAQMLLRSVQGELKGQQLNPLPHIETSLATARKMFGNPKVLDVNTGYGRPYGSYPYGSYKTTTGFLFPISNNDSRLHPKRRVLGVLSGTSATAYPVTSSSTTHQIVHDQLDLLKLIVLRSSEDNIAVVYKANLQGTGDLTFSIDTDRTDVYPFNIKDDQTGTSWNFLGEAVAGPLAGKRLEVPTSMIAYWFAWGTFYPDSELNEQ